MAARRSTAIFDEDVENYMGSAGYYFVTYDRHPKTIRKDAFGSTFWSTTGGDEAERRPRHRRRAPGPVRPPSSTPS